MEASDSGNPLGAIISPSAESLINSDDPLGLTTGLLGPNDLKLIDQLAQVRQRCGEACSSVPCWKQRAERNPEYWRKFSPGGIR